ncbi:probable 39S ribosomal protein L24, mitochondrial [Harpegnathos saltator]|uniref:Large ribosomal subunit protein uL24m n=1 Tax=Harpegnathos saltator TaxID=610380 RepID=E2BZG9_HARSA|nr:probable 39S ribosomal protein L24, mitochondrial [Harpegnathos saltator]XP_011147924.1 probable 39S ribosomal protein L24, mitochondrial [Harpegnathos saltator]EFN78867.1 Probable 39S ribosomal protein L24, mitochondrial [Harpegnathos saltator]
MRLISSLLQRSRMGEWSNRYANLPESYIKRCMEKFLWKTPRGKPNYLPRSIGRKRFYFSIHRPWTIGFQHDNQSGQNLQFVHVEPIKNWSFFRGDRVEILVGKDKGKQGIVKEIYQERNWVIVEGLNTKLDHVLKKKDFPGLYMLKEQPLLVTTDVRLIDPLDMQGTSIEWRYTEDGRHVRVSLRSGKIIPIPASNEETKDYKHMKLYMNQPKDTVKEQVMQVTFKPVLKTFEMDIMENMGIKEDRVPKKYYWY